MANQEDQTIPETPLKCCPNCGMTLARLLSYENNEFHQEYVCIYDWCSYGKEVSNV